MTARHALPLVLAAATLAACSAAPAAAPTQPSPRPSASSSAGSSSHAGKVSAAASCTAVPAATRAEILSGARPEVGRLSAASWSAHPAAGGLYVAARVTVPGVKAEPVVFRLASPTAGPVLSVDAVTAALFVWPRLGGYPRADVDAALGCLA